MDQVTQQNASLVEEAAAAANALEEQASMLSDAVSVFRLGQGTTNSQLRAIASNHWPRIISRSLWVDQHEWFRPGVTIDHPRNGSSRVTTSGCKGNRRVSNSVTKTVLG